MIIDAHLILGRSRYGTELLLDEALGACDAVGIQRGLTSTVHPVDHNFARANRALASALPKTGDRFVGLCRIDPWDGPPALDLVREMVASRGFRGVYLHPAEENFRINDDRLKAVADVAVELDVPVVVATGYPWFSEPTQVAEFASWCAKVPVVMTNGGQFNISGLSQTDAEAALGLENVLLQTTGVYREDFLQNVVATFGADRLLFASSTPQFDQRFELMRVQLLHVTEAEREAILWANAARVFAIIEAGTQ